MKKKIIENARHRLPEFNELLQRAAKGIRGKKRQEIRKGVQSLYKPLNVKGIKRLWFFLKYLGANNVPDIQNKVKIEDYVELAKQDLIDDSRYQNKRGEECAACGTHVRNFYVVGRNGVNKEVHTIGACCMKRMHEYNVDFGLVSAKREILGVKRERQLDELVATAEREKPRTVFLAQTSDSRDPTLGLKLFQSRGSYKNWLWNQEIPKDIEKLLQKAENPKRPFSRTEQKRLWQYVADHKLFSAKMFKGIVDDLRLLEQEGKIDLSKHKKKLSAQYAAITEIQNILEDAEEQGVDIKLERKLRNKATLAKYDDFSLAKALDEVLPVYEMEKERWRNAYVKQEYLLKQALTQSQYNFVKRLTKRWLSGIPKSPKGYNRTKLYHLATKIESVKDFAQTVQQLVGIYRQIQYAKAKFGKAEYRQLKKLSAEIEKLPENKRVKKLKERIKEVQQELDEPRDLLKQRVIPVEDFPISVNKLEKTYSENDKTWKRYHSQLDRVKEHARHGIVSEQDINVVRRLEKRIQKFIEIDKHPSANYIRKVQEAAKSKLVVDILFIKDREAFAEAKYLGPKLTDELCKRGTFPKSLVETAAREYGILKHQLIHYDATEDEILEDRQRLEEKFAKPHTLYAVHSASAQVVPIDFKPENLLEGKTIKYISPFMLDKYETMRLGEFADSEKAKRLHSSLIDRLFANLERDTDMHPVYVVEA